MNQRFVLLLLLALVLAGCSQEPEDSPATAPAMASTALPQLVERSNQLCRTVGQLQERINLFLDAPTEASLNEARRVWQEAHQAYRLVQSDYVQAGMTPPQIEDSRDPIDAYPILPGYLDQVPGYPHSGVVFSEVPLTPEFLTQEHQSTDFHYVIQGFHPLEFMLWGNPEESVADQVAKFLIPLPESDRIDVAARRKDLTRLMASALTRHSQALCHDGEQRRLTAAFTASGKPLALINDVSAVAHNASGTSEKPSE